MPYAPGDTWRSIETDSTELLVQGAAQWTQAAALPTPRQGLAGVTINNNIVVTGDRWATLLVYLQTLLFSTISELTSKILVPIQYCGTYFQFYRGTVGCFSKWNYYWYVWWYSAVWQSGSSVEENWVHEDDKISPCHECCELQWSGRLLSLKFNIHYFTSYCLKHLKKSI